MHRTVMPSAEWDREFIAILAAKRTWLRESEVVGIQLVDKTRLRCRSA
jgi:hypothetical protein